MADDRLPWTGQERPPETGAQRPPGRTGARRLLAWGGIVGPVGFIVAWAVSGAATEGYSPVTQAISRLAAAGAPTRWLMTAGFLSFGLAVPAYAAALRAGLPGRAWVAAAISGLATLGVAVFPLDVSARTDALHGGFAVLGYAALALVPMLAARPLAAAKRERAAAASLTLGVLSGACLVATLLGPSHGLFQRLGLTLGDAWLIMTAVEILRSGGYAVNPGIPIVDEAIAERP